MNFSNMFQALPPAEYIQYLKWTKTLPENIRNSQADLQTYWANNINGRPVKQAAVDDTPTGNWSQGDDGKFSFSPSPVALDSIANLLKSYSGDPERVVNI